METNLSANNSTWKMKMHYRAPLFLLLCAPFAAACVQELDTGADRQTKANLANPPPPPPKDPSIIPFEAEEPLVTPYGTNTPESLADSCAANTKMAMDVLDSYCSFCHSDPPHGGGQQGGFKEIMNPDLMATVTPRRADFSTFKYVTPGDPRKSLIFMRMSKKEMPLEPDVTQAAAHNYRFPLTVSDMSVIYTWIKDCLK